MPTQVSNEAVEKTIFDGLDRDRRRGRDHPRGDLREPRRRLARPRRAGPDRRGRVRRRARRRRGQGRQDGRRRDRPGGGASLVTRRIVITGVGAVTPLGVGATTADRALGRRRVRDRRRRRPLRRVRADRLPLPQGGAALGPLHPARDRGRRRGARRPPAGRRSCPYDAERIGCVIGTGIGGLGSLEQQQDVLRDRGAKAVSPLAVPLMMGNAAAAAVAMRHGLRGGSFGVMSACAAGAHAIGQAAADDRRRRGRRGRHRRRRGGAHGRRDGRVRGDGRDLEDRHLAALRRPSRRLRDGRGRRRARARGRRRAPSERGARGPRRGARLRGELRRPPPDRARARRAATPRGRSSSRSPTPVVEPGDIDYVNAHGTSTPLNDRTRDRGAEAGARRAAPTEVPVSSTKSAIGHLLGAAGRGRGDRDRRARCGATIAPPTVGWAERDPDLDLDYVPGEARALERRANGDGPEPLVAISNSFGFGGHNAVLCLSA